MAEDEVSLGIAQQLSETVQTLRNLPGSFHYLFDITAKKYEADYVLIDLSPGLGSINQNLVTTADFFVVPASPDVFSVMAMESLGRVLPRWISWARNAAKLEALHSADYPFPEPTLKFLGVIVQRYRLRAGSPTEAFGRYFDELDAGIRNNLVPALAHADILLDEDRYTTLDATSPYRLASIPDFNTLIANSQQSRKPVFALTRADVKRAGFVWDNMSDSIDSFRKLFKEMADKVENLTKSH